MKGAFHIHTNYSKDGRFSLEEVHKKGKELGYNFLVIIEHYEDLSKIKFQEFINNCKVVSNELKVIPGVEVEVKDKAHILIIGLKEPVDLNLKEIKPLREAIKKQNGLIGVAHLSYKFNLALEELTSFDFIEAWNYKHDKWLPNYKSLRIAKKNGSSYVIAGLDLHDSVNELGRIWIETKKEDVIGALRGGEFISKSRILELDSCGCITKNKAIYYLMYPLLAGLINAIKLINRLFTLMGISPPYLIRSKVKRLLFW